MTASIHGHEVLFRLLAAPVPMTRAELSAWAAGEFGEDARYHTCSADRMTLDELVEFLLARGKVTESNGGLVAHREEMCEH